MENELSKVSKYVPRERIYNVNALELAMPKNFNLKPGDNPLYSYRTANPDTEDNGNPFSPFSPPREKFNKVKHSNGESPGPVNIE